MLRTCYDHLGNLVVLPKTVIIQNRKLGLLKLILTMLMWTYIVVMMMQSRIWQSHLTPDASIGFWRDKSLDKEMPALVYAEKLQAPFCDRAFASLYDYVYGADWTFINASCGQLPDHLRMIRRSSGIFVPTFSTEALVTSQHTTDAGSDGECHSECAEMQNHTNSSGYSAWAASGRFNRYGHCMCERNIVQQSFLLGVEKVMIGFEISAVLDNKLLNQADEESNVLTVFRDAETNKFIKTVLPGDSIIVGIGELLTTGGYSLDDRLPTTSNLLGQGFTEFPVLRLTGLAMTLTFHFHNREDANHLHADHAGPVCYISVGINPKWTSYEFVVEDSGDLFDTPGRRSRYLYGIDINIKPAGSVSQFDFTSLFNALAAIIIYLRMPVVIVSLVARYLLGPLSDIYKNGSTEHFHPLSVLHGHCSRLLGAQETYVRLLTKQMKAHPQKEHLMESFLRQELTSIFHENMGGNHSLTEEEIAALLNIVMSVIDADHSGEVPFPEFINSFSNSEICSLTVHAALYNFKRKRGILEKMFQPAHINQATVLLKGLQDQRVLDESPNGLHLSQTKSSHRATEMHKVDKEVSRLKSSQDEMNEEISRLKRSQDDMAARIDQAIVRRLEKLEDQLGTSVLELQRKVYDSQPKPTGGLENQLSQVVSRLDLVGLEQLDVDIESKKEIGILSQSRLPSKIFGKGDASSSDRALPISKSIGPLEGDNLSSIRKFVSALQCAQEGQARMLEKIAARCADLAARCADVAARCADLEHRAVAAERPKSQILPFEDTSVSQRSTSMDMLGAQIVGLSSDTDTMTARGLNGSARKDDKPGRLEGAFARKIDEQEHQITALIERMTKLEHELFELRFTVWRDGLDWTVA